MADSILVVEDDVPVRRAVALALRQAGFSVQEASSGAEALAVIAQDLPDIVLLDSALPDVSGIAVLSQLRDAPATSTLPIIMVTARRELSDRVAGLRAGADDYVIKPFAAEELVARIRAQLRGRGAWGRSAAAHQQRVELARELVRSASHNPAQSAAAMTSVLSELDHVISAEILQLAPDGTASGLAAAADGSPIPGISDVPMSDVNGADLRPALAAGGIVPCRPHAATVDGVETELVVSPLGTGERRAAVVLAIADTSHGMAGGAPGSELLATLLEVAPVVEAVLVPQLADAELKEQARSALREIVQANGFTTLFQPIVDLATGAIAGYEALTRFDDGGRPDVRFAEAWRCGLGVHLECAAVERALRSGAETLPADVYLSVNVSSRTLTDPTFAAMVGRASLRPLVVEITEHEEIHDYDAVRNALAALGGEVRLAVDDAGSGYASLRHVLDLRADIVKLDRGWVSGIAADAARQALVLGISQFVARLGGAVVAEGIETAADLAILEELGVPYGQGFFLGRPSADVASASVIAGRR